MTETTAKKRRKRTPAEAWAAFRARVAELGGTVLEPAWLGNNRPHRVRCAAGHDCSPRPGHVQKGQGVCRVCANGSDVLWAAFRARIEALGGTVLEPAWNGYHKPHRVRCAAGHDSAPRPSGVLREQGICRPCAAGSDSAEAAFRQRVADLGGTVLEPAWLGNHTQHRVRCADGHEITTRPSHIQQGVGICRICAGRDPEGAWTAFRQRVADLGGTVLEPAWLGSKAPHRVRCADGHDCSPAPSSVATGHGICMKCAGQNQDTFYVVTGIDSQTGYATVKFGIGTVGARPRLNIHRADGLDKRHRVWTDEPTVWDLERDLREQMPLSGWRPTRDRSFEYFEVDALPVVLDFATDWLDRSLTYPLEGVAWTLDGHTNASRS